MVLLLAVRAYCCCLEVDFEARVSNCEARVSNCDSRVSKGVIKEGEGWESPRAPYEVKAWITAKTNDGRLIWSHVEREPFFFTFGITELPSGLEMGIGTMTRREKAFIYVTNQYLTKSSAFPQVIDLDEVHFEVELVHFVQAKKTMLMGDFSISDS